MDSSEQELIAQIEEFDPKTDTGRAIKFAFRYLVQADAEILAKVARVAAAIDRREAMERDRESLFKRVVMMFVNLKGWNK